MSVVEAIEAAQHGQTVIDGLWCGLVLLVQLRKLPMILSKLRANKKRYKELISGIPGLEFREITDAEGDIATMLTVILPKAEIAQKIAQELNTKVMAKAGWHVYNNMEQLLEHRTVSRVRW